MIETNNKIRIVRDPENQWDFEGAATVTNLFAETTTLEIYIGVLNSMITKPTRVLSIMYLTSNRLS